MVSQSDGVRVILGTGGTIAGRSGRPEDNVGYVAGQVEVKDLLLAVPGLRGLPLESEQVGQVDSKDMDLGLWQRLLGRLTHHLAREEVAGVVVTHGTDTLEETAFFVQQVLRPVKPVVFACAMRPATALVPDGPQNLLDAVRLTGDSQASGVLVVCAGQVHAAEHVTKVHSYRTDAFDSGDAGPRACLEEGEVRWFSSLQAPGSTDEGLLQRVLRAQRLPRVELVTSHAGADGGLVRALLRAGELDPDLWPQGIVVACTGNGTLHRELAAALTEASDRGVRIVRATRCARGRVIPDPHNAFVDSAARSPVKARLALALELLGA